MSISISEPEYWFVEVLDEYDTEDEGVPRQAKLPDPLWKRVGLTQKDPSVLEADKGQTRIPKITVASAGTEYGISRIQSILKEMAGESSLTTIPDAVYGIEYAEAETGREYDTLPPWRPSHELQVKGPVHMRVKQPVDTWIQHLSDLLRCSEPTVVRHALAISLGPTYNSPSFEGIALSQVNAHLRTYVNELVDELDYRIGQLDLAD